MKLKRSQQKLITRDAQILRHLRLSKKLSLNKAGRSVGISGSAIAHIEQGRMDISSARLETLVKAYGYTLNDYMEFADGRELPRNLRDECLLLLKKCDESKIKVLHPVISNLIQ
ncbi:MAG: helix-turn-helix domain-containing protein [Pseudobdellovibrionaceae bacterium]